MRCESMLQVKCTSPTLFSQNYSITLRLSKLLIEWTCLYFLMNVSGMGPGPHLGQPALQNVNIENCSNNFKSVSVSFMWILLAIIVIFHNMTRFGPSITKDTVLHRAHQSLVWALIRLGYGLHTFCPWLSTLVTHKARVQQRWGFYHY